MRCSAQSASRQHRSSNALTAIEARAARSAPCFHPGKQGAGQSDHLRNQTPAGGILIFRADLPGQWVEVHAKGSFDFAALRSGRTGGRGATLRMSGRERLVLFILRLAGEASGPETWRASGLRFLRDCPSTSLRYAQDEREGVVLFLLPPAEEAIPSAAPPPVRSSGGVRSRLSSLPRPAGKGGDLPLRPSDSDPPADNASHRARTPMPRAGRSRRRRTS